MVGIAGSSHRNRSGIGAKKGERAGTQGTRAESECAFPTGSANA
jgi:hypothetical protein